MKTNAISLFLALTIGVSAGACVAETGDEAGLEDDFSAGVGDDGKADGDSWVTITDKGSGIGSRCTEDAECDWDLPITCAPVCKVDGLDLLCTKVCRPRGGYGYFCDEDSDCDGNKGFRCIGHMEVGGEIKEVCKKPL